MKSFELHPIDTLYLRDARPMESGAGSGGHGASWPLPMVLHDALRSALLRQVAEIHPRRQVVGHRRFRNGQLLNDPMIFTTAFRSLRTLGPLPARNKKLFLPRPLDVVPDGGEGRKTTLLRLLEGPREGSSNWPVRWLHPLISPGRPGKQKLPLWIPVDAFCETLQGKAPVLDGKEELYEPEPRLGIELDPATGATVEGKLYTAEHLRLPPDVSLWFQAALSERRSEEENRAPLESVEGSVFPLGGESRMTHCSASDIPAPNIPPPAGRRIKWVLAIHAVFNGGWRPNWVDEETGAVLLKRGDAERRAEEDRETWRLRVRALPAIRAKLLAACVGKPIHFSGWDLGWTPPDKPGAPPGGPKPTLLAAPAGSVYYFEAESDDDARALVRALHGRVRSDFLGEKGLGWGFCGTWDGMDVGGRLAGGNEANDQR